MRVSCVSHDFASVHYCLLVTCWDRTDLLALVGDVYCICVTFPCGILGQRWYLIVSLPDLRKFLTWKLLVFCARGWSAVCDCGISLIKLTYSVFLLLLLFVFCCCFFCWGGRVCNCQS